MAAAVSQSNRWDAVERYLDRVGISYEPLEHPPAWSALDQARKTGFPPEQVAKAVVLYEGDWSALALVPANRRVALKRVHRLVGEDSPMRLATEREIAADFPLMEVGATPPVGPNPPHQELIDWRLIEQERVVFAGGDHRHSFIARPSDIVALAHAAVANLCNGDHWAEAV